MTTVSVIIPVYNTEKYLEQCLDSVINQTLKDIEIICVDDGSTDNSHEILKKYASKDKRITIIHQENKHAGVSRNTGLAAATGQYVHFLDSDDWLEEDAYEKLYKIFLNNDVDFIKFCGKTYNDITDEVKRNDYTSMSLISDEHFDSTISPSTDFKIALNMADSAWSGIYKKEFLSKNNIYFDDLICANDVGFFFRCVIKSNKIYLLSDELIYYRINRENSLIKNRPQHFDCQLALYPITKNICRNLDSNKQKIIINHIVDKILFWYRYIIADNTIKPKVKSKIRRQMKDFIKTIEKEDLDQNNLKIIYAIKKEKLYSIFSAINNKTHKVITIFGIKIKFKRKNKNL